MRTYAVQRYQYRERQASSRKKRTASLQHARQTYKKKVRTPVEAQALKSRRAV